LANLFDEWGLAGTYDFLLVPFDSQSQANMGYVVVNFIDPVFVPLFFWLYQNQVYNGMIAPADLQGAEANREHWKEYSTPDIKHMKLIALEARGGLGFKPSGMPPDPIFVDAIEPGSWADRNGLVVGDMLLSMNGWMIKDMNSDELMEIRKERPLQLMFERKAFASEPVSLPDAMPTQWAVNTVNMMLSPHSQEHFHKTKMCTFWQQGRCDRASGCPFAHTKSELLPTPDLAKTKLCYSYFRGKCNDRRCKFAHGSRELRATWDAAFAQGMMCMDGSFPMFPSYDMQEENGAPMGQGAGMQGMLVGGDMSGYAVTNDGTFARMTSSSEDGSSDPLGAFPASGSSNSGAGSQTRRMASFDRQSSPLKGIRELGTSYVRESLTFMETLESKPLEENVTSLTRSWSDSDLPAFREALDDSALV
jgi:hypothetical protein